MVFKLSTEGLPRSLHGKEPPAHAGDVGWISGSRRFPGGENDNSFQYSCLEKSHAQRNQATIAHGVTKMECN